MERGALGTLLNLPEPQIPPRKVWITIRTRQLLCRWSEMSVKCLTHGRHSMSHGSYCLGMFQELSLPIIHNAGQKYHKQMVNVIANIKICLTVLSFRKVSYMQIPWELFSTAVASSLQHRTAVLPDVLSLPYVRGHGWGTATQHRSQGLDLILQSIKGRIWRSHLLKK